MKGGGAAPRGAVLQRLRERARDELRSGDLDAAITSSSAALVLATDLWSLRAQCWYRKGDLHKVGALFSFFPSCGLSRVAGDGGRREGH
jgi:hypothetical protein